MAGETIITVVGNLTADPELRFTPGGQALANFTVASTPRTLNRQTQQWEDGEALFLRCSVWREQAESVAESLTRGMRVIVTGRLGQRSWDDKDGNKRTSVELTVDEVGPSLRWAQATVTRAQRGQSGRQQQADGDPWSSPPPRRQPAPAGAGAWGGGGEEPPF